MSETDSNFRRRGGCRLQKAKDVDSVLGFRLGVSQARRYTMDWDRDETLARNDEAVEGNCTTWSGCFTKAFFDGPERLGLRLSFSRGQIVYLLLSLVRRNASVIKGIFLRLLSLGLCRN